MATETTFFCLFPCLFVFRLFLFYVVFVDFCVWGFFLRCFSAHEVQGAIIYHNGLEAVCAKPL